MDTDIPLDLIKLMYEEEEEKCTFLMAFVFVSSKTSFDPKLLDKSCKTNKDTTNFIFYWDYLKNRSIY